MKKGILLLNLGTPQDASTASVRRYLHTFLMDPRVIELPAVLRFLLVYGLIVPFRARKSAHAYQQIWTAQGSPLLVNSLALKDALAAQLGPDYVVALGMRYGKPSIQEALSELHAARIDHLKILPLFPQYASASSGSAIEVALGLLAKQWSIPNIQLIRDFHALPGYIESYAALIQAHRQQHLNIEYILFSYHGLPEQHLKKTGCRANCVLAKAYDPKNTEDSNHLCNPCPKIDKNNSACYRAQCYATTQLIAEKLELGPAQYQTCFQSRLGRRPWIKPYTDEVLIALRQKGLRHIAIVCPSFVADCLETLEEINLRARAQWQNLGGESFVFIPCLNDQPLWIEALARILDSDFTTEAECLS